MKKQRGSRIAERGPDGMRAEYDFSKGRRNPYAARLAKGYTVRILEDGVVLEATRVAASKKRPTHRPKASSKRGAQRKRA